MLDPLPLPPQHPASCEGGAEPLCLVRGDAGSSSFVLDRGMASIGRDSQCDLVLHNHLVSRFHALVERIDDQQVLRDLGSTNGTYLNGLRLSGDQAFALRSGDVIEVGPERLLVASGRESQSPSALLERRGSEYALADLVREGTAQIPPADLVAFQREVLAGFARSLSDGLEDALALVRRRMRANAAVLFRRDPAGKLGPLASHPPAGVAEVTANEPLAALATRAWVERQGLLLHGHGRPRDDRFSETHVQGQWSAAAVPLEGTRDAPPGALVVGRAGRSRLDRRDLATLAVLADRIALALGIRDTPAEVRRDE